MKKEARLLRVGVLGCGPIAQFAHFDACRKARNVELYAICDRATDLTDRMGAIYQPRRKYYQYEEMLADPEVEAVVIAVSDQFHCALCQQALAAGKPVLVEKPLGVTVEECEELAHRVKAAGLPFQVGNMKRFDPGIAFAAQFIREEMGDLLALKAWYCDSVYRYTMTDNLQPLPVLSPDALKPAGNPKADKSKYYMLTHGSHLVDTARCLAGELRSVQARLVQKFGAYCWFVDVEFANAALGHLDLTIAVRMDFHEGFQIYGEHGSVLGRTYLPWFFKSSEVECFSTRTGQYHRPLGADAHFYKLQVEGFADSILHGAPLRGAGIDDGVAALRALSAIALSVRTGERVSLSDAKGGV